MTNHRRTREIAPNGKEIHPAKKSTARVDAHNPILGEFKQLEGRQHACNVGGPPQISVDVGSGVRHPQVQVSLRKRRAPRTSPGGSSLLERFAVLVVAR